MDKHLRVMGQEEAGEFVLRLLWEKGPLSTAEIMRESEKQGLQCPESTGSFLARMRFKGKLKGGQCVERRVWMWMVTKTEV